MLTRTEIIRQLDREYQQKAERARADASRARADLEARLPELAGLDDEYRRLTLQLARRIASDEPVEELRAAQKKAERAVDELLARNGVARADLEPRYECAICHDTGRTPDGGVCACYRRALLDRLCRDLSVDGEGSFEAFDLTVFPEGAQREDMRELRDKMLRYAEDFPDYPRRTITFCGEAGLGKTFLLNCIARRVLERGFSVARLTAFGLMEEMRAEHTGRSERNLLADLREADLLVLDDLGTEPFYNNITLEYLFSLLNERSMRRRHTLLSTNLTPVQLRERYGERIYSRLAEADCAAVTQLTGVDVRSKRR